jgi:hypothetical protein
MCRVIHGRFIGIKPADHFADEAAGIWSAIRAWRSAGVPAFTMGAMLVAGGAAAVVPGPAQAVARVATDKAMRVRTACMVNS